MRRSVVAVATVGLLVLATGSGGTRTGGPAGAGPPADPTPGPAAAQLPPWTEPGDGGAVELVEAGVSVAVDAGSGDEYFGFGFVVENTSESVATSTGIRVYLLDAAGDRIWAGRSLETGPIAVLLPGERFGAGDLVQFPGTAEPAAVEVAIGDSLWYPLDTPSADFRNLTTGDVTLDRHGEGCAGVDVEFTLGSRYDQPMRVGMGTVIRDGDGVIVGGSHMWWDDDFTAEPGVSSYQRSLRGSSCVSPLDGHEDVTVELYPTPRSIAEED